jgi:hypothetical protein
MSHRDLVIGLVMHVLYSGFLFCTIVFVAWIISFGLQWLESIHPFDGDTHFVTAYFGTGSLIFDYIVTTISLLVGIGSCLNF